MIKKKLKIPSGLKEGDVVSVEWRDHAGAAGWWSKEGVLEEGPVLCHSVGFFVGFSKDGASIVLSGTMANGSDRGSNLNCIQWRLLKEVTKIQKIKR